MKRVLPIALALAALTATACNSSSDTPPAPTPAPPSQTEIFTGTVPLLDTHNGSEFHNFTMAQSGEVDVTLTAAGPPPTIQMGIGLGQPTTTTCPHSFGSVTVAAGPNLAGAVQLNAGTYCVDVFDVGNAAAPITYSI